MKPKKNAFGCFVNMLFPVGALYAPAGCAVSGIYRIHRSKVLKLREEKEVRPWAQQEKQDRVEKKCRDEEELRRLRMEAMQSKFDMKDASERGLIHIAATEACCREESQDEA